MRKLISVSWVLVSLYLLSACVPLTPVVSIVVTRDGGYTPEGCGPVEVAELLLDFLDAQNRGDQKHLASFFGDRFMWYSVTQGAPPPNEPRHVAFIANPNRIVEPGSETYSRAREQMIAELLDYLAEQHAQNQWLSLQEVSLTGGSTTSMDIGYRLRINSDELDLEKFRVTVLGKANVDCENRKINVWSMGVTVRPHAAGSDSMYQISACPPGPSTIFELDKAIRGLLGEVIACTY